MKLFSRLRREKKSRPPLFEKIAYFIEWGEWIVLFIKWVLGSLRTFPPLPVFTETKEIEDEKKDHTGSD